MVRRPVARDHRREILVRVHRRVAVVAHDPEMRVVPPAAALGVGANVGRRVVDDAHRLVHSGASWPRACDVLSTPVNAANSEVGPLLAHASRRLTSADLAVDVEPAARRRPRKCVTRGAQRRARRQRADAPRALAARASMTLSAPRLSARARRSSARSASRSLVDARASGGRRSCARSRASCTPSRARSNQRSPGSPDRAGKAPHEERRVRRPRDRGEDRRDAMQRALRRAAGASAGSAPSASRRRTRRGARRRRRGR